MTNPVDVFQCLYAELDDTDLVEQLKRREEFGWSNHGQPLIVNGQNFRREALEEILDAIVYLAGHSLQEDDTQYYDDYAALIRLASKLAKNSPT